MLGEDYFVGKAVEGAAKGVASTLIKNEFTPDNSDSPISNPEDCFWGADGQLYCPVNKVPQQQHTLDDTKVYSQDPYCRERLWGVLCSANPLPGKCNLRGCRERTRVRMPQ